MGYTRESRICDALGIAIFIYCEQRLSLTGIVSLCPAKQALQVIGISIGSAGLIFLPVVMTSLHGHGLTACKLRLL